jgi:hypothetical protein
MGRRGSYDRLEALSLEIERKLHKVTHRFPYRAPAGARQFVFVALNRGPISVARTRSHRFARNSRAAAAGLQRP